MFKNHPKGLAVLFFTELWERFGYYTLMAILVLYMEKEFHFDDSVKGNYYSLFLLVCYMFSLFGGWLGDRVTGSKKAIYIGNSMMIAGYIALTFSSVDRLPLFIGGLALVAVGTGIFKVNMTISVGTLYTKTDARKDSGYNIYYMGVNIGATLAPLAATAISLLYNSYNYSFAAAALGLMLALVIFMFGNKHITGIDTVGAAADTEASAAEQENPGENRQRIGALLTLFAIVIFFWIAFYQNGFALTLFAERSTATYTYLRPETYQFFNPFFILALTPLLVMFFARMRERGKEPASARKILYGMTVSGFSMVVMIFASLLGGDLDQPIMSPGWLIGSYFIVTIAELLVSPMGLSYVSKVAPRKWQGVMMGCWFVATSLGASGSGLLGKFYSSFAHHQYYALLSVLLFASAGLVFLFRKRLNKFGS